MVVTELLAAPTPLALVEVVVACVPLPLLNAVVVKEQLRTRSLTSI